MCVDVDEPIQIFDETKPVARKQHKCNECRRVIEKGEQYYRMRGMDYYREYWFGYVCCLQCLAATRWLLEVCNGFLYEGVHEDLQEHVEENYYPIRTLSLVRLTNYMGNRWRRKNGDLISVELVRKWVKSGVALAKLDHAA